MPQTYSFTMKSSTVGMHSVECGYDDAAIHTLVCDCPAGQFGDLCKHLKSFFAADTSLLFDDDPDLFQTQSFHLVCDRLKASEIYEAYQRLLADIAAIELNQTALKQAAKNLKLRFVRKLNGKI